MDVIEITPGDEEMILAAARVAQAAFAHIPYCDMLEEARQEVREALAPGKICLAAISTPTSSSLPKTCKVWPITHLCSIKS